MYFINACSSCKVKLCYFQSPSSFFLILKKTSHTSFCFFETSKLVSPQFLLLTLFCFRERNGVKTLKLTSINFVYMRLPYLRRIAGIAMARCTREAKFEAAQRHCLNWKIHCDDHSSLSSITAIQNELFHIFHIISKYINLIFCYVIQNVSPFNICKN